MSRDALHLSDLLTQAVAARPDRLAVEDADGRNLTYAGLDHAADRVAARLARWGVGREDRVGLWLPKGIEAVAAIHGILRAGAAYVPVDPLAPVPRGSGVLADAHVRAVVIASQLVAPFRDHWPGPGPLPRLIAVGEPPIPAADATWHDVQADDSPTPLPPPRAADDLAYVLYTSGSTGKPKGVMLSHANAFCFLDWCRAVFDTNESDRFSSHAPFHFDLSIFDLFVSCRSRAALVLIGEALGKDPAALGRFVHDRKLSVWYSAPSILALMAQYGGLESAGYQAPRLVLFAGEVFPIRHLRRLRALWPDAALWNLYGPTETNVCTAFPIPAVIPEDRLTPFPIGPACPPLRGRVIDEHGQDVPPETRGELVIAGPGVMRGYFGRADLDAAAFLVDTQGERWYRTGDLVTADAEGCYTYHGRRDRMVKKRGYRIELGEVESALSHHEDVDRAAVIASSDDEGLELTAFVALKATRKGSIIAMKRHCTRYLPHYMVPDRIAFLPSLPMTSTDKVDYPGLMALARRDQEPNS